MGTKADQSGLSKKEKRKKKQTSPDQIRSLKDGRTRSTFYQLKLETDFQVFERVISFSTRMHNKDTSAQGQTQNLNPGFKKIHNCMHIC